VWVGALGTQSTDAVEVLEVSRRGLDDEAVRPLVALLLSASVLESFSRLSRVDLSGNVLGNDGCVLLGESVAALHGRPMGGLRYLCLASNRIGAQGAAALAGSFFPDCTSLDTDLVGVVADEYALVLSDNPLGDTGVEAVTSSVIKTRCRVALHMCNVGCTGRGCNAVAESLPWLSSLDLGYNTIPIARLETLVSSAGNHLRQLSLAQMAPNDGRSMSRNLVVQALADLLTSGHTPLASLNLASNDLQDSGLRLLADALVADESPHVQVLDLSQNRLQDGNLLANILVHGGERLATLNLEGNELGDLAVVALAAGIALAPPLRRLNLSRNRFGDDGVIALAHTIRNQGDFAPSAAAEQAAPSPEGIAAWLQNLRGLQASPAWAWDDAEAGLLELDVSVNMIMDDGAIALAESVSRCTSNGVANLARLDLSDNSIGNAGRDALESVVRASHQRVQAAALSLAAAGALPSSEARPPPRPLSGGWGWSSWIRSLLLI